MLEGLVVVGGGVGRGDFRDQNNRVGRQCLVKLAIALDKLWVGWLF